MPPHLVTLSERRVYLKGCEMGFALPRRIGRRRFANRAARRVRGAGDVSLRSQNVRLQRRVAPTKRLFRRVKPSAQTENRRETAPGVRALRPAIVSEDGRPKRRFRVVEPALLGERASGANQRAGRLDGRLRPPAGPIERRERLLRAPAIEMQIAEGQGRRRGRGQRPARRQRLGTPTEHALRPRMPPARRNGQRRRHGALEPRDSRAGRLEMRRRRGIHYVLRCRLVQPRRSATRARPRQ
jgi:hypothetical protein